MRTLARWLLSAAAVTAIALVGGNVAGGTRAAKPALRFVRVDPLIVAGRSFRSAERVTVTARIGQSRRIATVTANGEGAFRVRLGHVRKYNPCGAPLAVSARGAQGSSATVRTLPRMCADRQP